MLLAGLCQALLFLCVCLIAKLLRAGRHKQLCMLLAVCAITDCGPSMEYGSSMHCSCFGPRCQGSAVCKCRSALDAAIMQGHCRRAGIFLGAWVSLARMVWARARARAQTLPQLPPTLLARHANTTPTQQLLPACWDLTWSTGQQGLHLHIGQQELLPHGGQS